MPVSCKLIDGKWRLAHLDGTLSSVTTEHITEESCQKQAAAINMHLEASLILCPDKEAFLICSDDNSGLTFEKELVYEGNFANKQAGIQFSVNKTILDHWHSTADVMLSNGIKIPLPIGHTEDPEKSRGEITKTIRRKNKLGKESLFGICKFRDVEAAKLAKTTDASIFVTKEFVDSQQNQYIIPIRHVALTDYPAIQGLEKFESIAASLVIEDPVMITPALLALANKLGVQNTQSMSDDQIVEAISLLSKPTQPKTLELPALLVASLTKTFKTSRLTQLDALVTGGHITKASRDLLETDWCSEPALALSVTETDAVPTTESAFINLIAALKQNIAMSFGEKSKQQTTCLVNELVQNAETRAAAAKN